MQSARENNIVALPDSAATMTKEEADGTARFPSSEACLPRAENTAAVARARSASALSRKRGSRHTHTVRHAGQFFEPPGGGSRQMMHSMCGCIAEHTAGDEGRYSRPLLGRTRQRRTDGRPTQKTRRELSKKRWPSAQPAETGHLRSRGGGFFTGSTIHAAPPRSLTDAPTCQTERKARTDFPGHNTLRRCNAEAR